MISTLKDLFSTLKTKEELLTIRQNAPLCPGLYFLYQKEEIVYIGRSESILRRIAAHQFQFDSFSVIEMPYGETIIYEPIYIARYKPKYNSFILIDQD